MTALHWQIIAALSMAAAVSIFFFDTRHKRHNKLASWAAWVLFCLYGSLSIAALLKLEALTIWLLLVVLALSVADIALARGNISKVLPECIPQSTCPVPNKRRNQKQPNKPQHVMEGKHNAVNR